MAKSNSRSFKMTPAHEKFYIYFHINPIKNEVFYVGKGSKRRAYSKCDRNKFWKNITNKYGYAIDIIESNLTEEEAFDREKYWIKKIGRRDLGFGSLVNMTDGGDNPPSTKGRVSPMKGKKQSESAKIKIGLASKGNTYGKSRKGIPLSEEHKLSIKNSKKNISVETRKKLSEQSSKRTGFLNNNSKIVINLENGIFYESIRECLKYNDITIRFFEKSKKYKKI